MERNYAVGDRKGERDFRRINNQYFEGTDALPEISYFFNYLTEFTTTIWKEFNKRSITSLD